MQKVFLHWEVTEKSISSFWLILETHMTPHTSMISRRRRGGYFSLPSFRKNFFSTLGLWSGSAFTLSLPSAHCSLDLGCAPRPAARGQTPQCGSTPQSAAQTCLGDDTEPSGFFWRCLFFVREFRSTGWSPLAGSRPTRGWLPCKFQSEGPGVPGTQTHETASRAFECKPAAPWLRTF